VAVILAVQNQRVGITPEILPQNATLLYHQRYRNRP